jgi:hypothetical protein
MPLAQRQASVALDLVAGHGRHIGRSGQPGVEGRQTSLYRTFLEIACGFGARCLHTLAGDGNWQIGIQQDSF